MIESETVCYFHFAKFIASRDLLLSLYCTAFQYHNHMTGKCNISDYEFSEKDISGSMIKRTKLREYICLKLFTSEGDVSPEERLKNEFGEDLLSMLVGSPWNTYWSEKQVQEAVSTVLPNLVLFLKSVPENLDVFELEYIEGFQDKRRTFRTIDTWRKGTDGMWIYEPPSASLPPW